MIDNGRNGSRPPSDRFNLAYAFLLLHGIGFLLPWNVFINAKEYFVDYKLNTTTSYDADYRINFMSYIGFAAQFPGMCFAAWNTFHQSRSKSSSAALRFVVAMVVEVAVLLFTIAFTMIDTSHIPGTFFALTIASVVLINCCVGIHQTLTFGLAAVLPMSYSNAVILGSNACGTIISSVNIITKWLASVHGRTAYSIVVAAIAYFLSAFAIVFACVVTFFWLHRLPFVRYYVDLSHKCLEVPVPGSEEDSLSVLNVVQSNSCSVDGDHHLSTPLTNHHNTPDPDARLESPPPGTASTDPLETASLLNVDDTAPQTSGKLCNAGRCFGALCKRHHCRAYWSRYRLCFSECWSQCLNVWSVFFCSLSIFPAIQSMIQPLDPNYFIAPRWFVDVSCFLFFNLFAMFGCILSNWVQFPGPRYLWIPVWIRTCFFIPFFLFCNFNLTEPKVPVLVTSDHVYVFAAIAFAFTNGYFSSLAMMYAPKNSPPERAELAGMLAALFLIVGVCSGVYTSRGLVGILM